MNSVRTKIMTLGLTLLAALAGVQAPAQASLALNIEAQPIGDALNEFARQTGLQVVLFAEVSEGITTPHLAGNFMPEIALKMLLENTGLKYEYINDRTVAIRSGKAGSVSLSSRTFGISNQPNRLHLAQADAAQSDRSAQSDLPATDNKAAPALEEITVTAERRQERAQDVPISMSVFSRDFIKQYISDPFELANLTPNYQLATGDAMLTGVQATLRGLGSAEQSNPLSSTSILTYYDGIAAGTPLVAVIPQWDLDRIEVQRGPQGTLYGRNAVGGAIQYISAAPTEEFEGYGELTMGEFDLRRFEGVISGPITENVKARLSALTYDRGGDITDTFRNTKQGERDWWGVKGTIDWQISEDFDARMRAQHFEGNADAGLLFNAAPGHLLAPNVRAWLDTIGADPDLPRASNFERIQSGLQDPFQSVDFNMVEMDLNYDFGSMVLTAIGGYLDGQDVFNSSPLNYPAPMADFLNFNDITQWSGEVRLTSQTDHPLQWIGGVYYQRTEDGGASGNDITALLRDLDGDGLTRYNADSSEDLLDGLIPAFAGAGNFLNAASVEQELETHALFVHTTYDWTDRLTTTHAVRYTHEEKGVDVIRGAFFEFPVSFGVTPGTLAQHDDFVKFARLDPARQRQLAVSIFSDLDTLDANGNVVPLSLSETWEEVTWRFAADYQLTDDALIYSSISKGFRGGIWGGNDVLADPETSIVYEVGAKTQGFGNRLQVNSSVFYDEHHDLQTSLFAQRSDGSFFNLVANLPAVKLYGGEIEIKTVPVENLLIAANFGFLETEITDAPPGNEAILGNELPGAADKSFSGIVRYDVHAALGTFSPQLSWRYWGASWSLKDNNDVITGKLGNFWTADVRLGYESPNGNLYGLFYLKNIFDEVHPLRNAQPNPVLGTTLSPVNERRNWGITVGYRF